MTRPLVWGSVRNRGIATYARIRQEGTISITQLGHFKDSVTRAAQYMILQANREASRQGANIMFQDSNLLPRITLSPARNFVIRSVKVNTIRPCQRKASVRRHRRLMAYRAFYRLASPPRNCLIITFGRICFATNRPVIVRLLGPIVKVLRQAANPYPCRCLRVLTTNVVTRFLGVFYLPSYVRYRMFCLILQDPVCVVFVRFGQGVPITV